MEQRADVVFVVDASDSMKPCFEQLKRGIEKFVMPFSQAGYESLRLGLLAYNAGANNGQWVFRHSFLAGDEPERMQDLYSDEYSDDDPVKEAFFTKSEGGNVDTASFCRALNRIRCCADENTPLALDCAADFPFEPLGMTRRVIVLFTDEKLEDGVLKNEPLGENCSTIDKIMQKIESRHISLYYFGPECEGAEVISQYSRVVVTPVKDFKTRSENEDVWSGIDFNKVMEGIGRAVSASVLQVVDEDEYEKAVYGQDQWSLEKWGKSGIGKNGIIDITDQPEGIELNVSKPLSWVNAKLFWTTPIDLDLHAFYKLKDQSAISSASSPLWGANSFLSNLFATVEAGQTKGHVFFGNRKDDFMALDDDRGINCTLDSGGNEENIKCTSLAGIERILFATKIYTQKGCFSDYNGRVEITTSNEDQPSIHVEMRSNERLDWCVIAMIDNSDPNHPRVYPINMVMQPEPDVDDPRWIRNPNKR